jgi:hypothetical protein
MEETVARIRTHKGVEAVIIMDRRGKKKTHAVFTSII